MNRPMYYDKAGNPITLEELMQLNSPEYKRVAETTLEDGTWINTVWLGLDHAWGGDGDPLIFETMVFSSHESLDDLDQVRYSTLIEAQAGHLAMVVIWSQEGLP